MDEDVKKPEIVTRIEKRWKYVEQRYGPFVSRADKDIRFERGEQWEEDNRKKLEDAGRPVLTKNRIKPKVNLMKGYQAENRYYFKVTAADDVSQEELGIVEQIVKKINALLKKAENENDAEYELSDCFCDGIRVGKGYLEVYEKVKKHVYPYKKILMFNALDHRHCFPDPDSVRHDLSDMRDFFKAQEISEEGLIEMFPKKKDVIVSLMKEKDYLLRPDDGIEHDDYPMAGSEAAIATGGDVQKEDEAPYILKEYWYYKIKRSSQIAIQSVDETGQQTFTVNDVAEKKLKAVRELNEQKQMMNPNHKFKIVDIEKKQWYVAHYCSGKILKEEEWPLDICPFAQYLPDRIKGLDEVERRDIGIIRDMRSNQEEYNKISSMTLAHLISNVNSGLWGEENAFKDIEKIKKHGSAPGFIGIIKKNMWDRWRKEPPAQLSQGHFVLAEQSAKDMDESSNIRPDLLGVAKKDQSGRALALTQRQGLRGISFYFDQFRRTKHQLAKILVKFICYQNEWDYDKLKVVIDDTAESPTMRYANFLETKELFESGALDSPFGDLIIEGMNITNKDKYIQRWKEIMGMKKAQAEAEQQAQQQQQQQGQQQEQAAAQGKKDDHDVPQNKAAAENAARQDAENTFRQAG